MPFTTDYTATDTGPTDFARVVRDFTWAFQERLHVSGLDWRWPRYNAVWESGVIGALDDNEDGTWTMTDAATGDDEKQWIVTNLDPEKPGGEAPRWYDWYNPAAKFLPRYYDVILNCEDKNWSRHIRCQILDVPDDNKLKITGNLIDYQTGKWINWTELIGKRYVILKRHSGSGNPSLWWGERLPKWPNDREKWVGDGFAISVVKDNAKDWGDNALVGRTLRVDSTDYAILSNTANSVTIGRPEEAPTGDYEIKDGEDVLYEGTISVVNDGIRDENNVFAAGVVGLDLVLYGADGRMHRIVTNGFSRHEIWIPRQTHAVGGGYVVVATNGKAFPRAKELAFRWYGGAQEGYYTHYPQNVIGETTIGTVGKAAYSVKWMSQIDESMEPEEITVPAFRQDVWSDLMELASPADKCYSPDYFKAFFHALQQYILELLVYGFVAPKDYAGEKAINNLSPATALEAAGINFVGRFTSTAANEEGIFSFTVTGLPAGVTEYFWEIIDNYDGESRAAGFSGETVFSGGFEGRTYTLVVALGLTRKRPWRFRYAYPATTFIPDTGEFGGVQMPPNQEYPGWWTKRGKSTAALTHEGLGHAEDGGGAFVAGRRYRYVGDNWGDSTTGIAASAGGAAIAAYHRNLWEGRFRKDLRPLYNTKKTARALYGGKNWLRVKDVDWWTSPIGQGVLRTESITATAGTSTTLTLATKKWTPPDEDDEVIDPFWTGERFVGMTLEVTKTVKDVEDEDQTVVYRTPITGMSVDEDDSTLTFMPVAAFTIPEVRDSAGNIITPEIDAPALTVGADDPVVIREPKLRMNWWEGRTIRIRQGETVTEKIVTHNDDTHVWWSGELTNAVDGETTIELVELDVGHVYQWSGSGWITPTSNPKDLAQNGLHEGCDTLYGYIQNGDFIGEHVFDEIYRLFNVLYMTQKPVGWRSRTTWLEVAEDPGQNPPTTDPYREFNSLFAPSDLTASEWEEILSEAAGEGWTTLPWEYHALIGEREVGYFSPDKPTFAHPEPPRAELVRGYDGANPSSIYSLASKRQYAYPFVDGVPVGISSTPRLHIKGDIPLTEGEPGPWDLFNAFGDPVGDKVYSDAGTLPTSSTDPLRRGDAIGSASAIAPAPRWPEDMPPLDPIPFDPERRAHGTEGYRVTSSKVVLVWDLEYLDL